MNITVALVYGGASEEHDVSISGYHYVHDLLKKNNFNVVSVYIGRNGVWSVDNAPSNAHVFLKRTHQGGFLCFDGCEMKIDAAIPLLHGEGGESGEVQGLFECAGIPYVGANVATSAVCLDKHFTKCVAKKMGIPTAKWISFSEKCDTDTAISLCEDKIGFPMFIKPRRLGSSIGAGVVKCRTEFEAVFHDAMEIGGNRVLVEELIEDKRELECAFYQAKGKTVITHPSEILHSGFYGYKEKYTKSTKTSVMADIDTDTAQTIGLHASLLASELGLRHLGRIDFFLTGGKVIFNEVNTFPGFTPTSLYPQMLQTSGIYPEDALKNFIEDAIEW